MTVTIAALKRLADIIQRGSNDARFKATWDELLQEWVSEIATDQAEVVKRIEALEQDAERVRVVQNYRFEGTREATDARRNVLARMAAGSVLSTLSAAELARVERTMRELDAEDLELLLAIASEEGEQMPPGQARYQLLRAGHLNGEYLIAAGCVRVYAPPVFDSYDACAITAIGEMLLKVWREPSGRSTE